MVRRAHHALVFAVFLSHLEKTLRRDAVVLLQGPLPHQILGDLHRRDLEAILDLLVGSLELVVAVLIAGDQAVLVDKVDLFAVEASDGANYGDPVLAFILAFRIRIGPHFLLRLHVNARRQPLLVDEGIGELVGAACRVAMRSASPMGADTSQLLLPKDRRAAGI